MFIKDAALMRTRSINISLWDIVLPLLMIFSAARGWYIGQEWAVPSHFMMWALAAVVLALASVLFLPRTDEPALQILPAIVAFFVGFALGQIPLPELYSSGALESKVERVMGYMVALPYSFVYLRTMQVSASRITSVVLFLFFSLYFLWGIAAAVLREHL
ncbi:MAG: hypothetical protein JNN25_10840 [Candidatus Kapabacteria bacterium]|nr:hypothetical protein [Candidatus Kapabacteria bacterium]